MKKILEFMKKETVLCVAAMLAVLSMFFVYPDKQYAAYMDYRVLALLFCLMAVVAGLQKNGVFYRLGVKLVNCFSTSRGIVMTLVMLCFITSMFITNDVALITFVPFAILILSMTEQHTLMIRTVVLQTIAANLGSMLTPMGNPQNLYLYTKMGCSMGEFISMMLPLTAISLVLILLGVFTIRNHKVVLQNEGLDKEYKEDKRMIVIYFLLFLLALLGVTRVIAYQIVLLIIAVIILVMDREVFKRVDYMLLLTFISFFVFIGNLQRIPAFQNWMQGILENREIIISVLASQVISNVPAAMLLSGFTAKFQDILYGVNIGGLGTLIASMASLISYKYYVSAEKAEKGRYFTEFTVWNILFLIPLVVLALTI